MDATFWTTLAGVIIMAIGLVFAGWQLQLMRKSSESSLLMYLMERWDSDEFVKARKAVLENAENFSEKMKRFEEANDEKYFLVVKIGNYFEDVGMLAVKKYLPEERVINLLGHSAHYYYEIFKEWVKENRKQLPDLYEYFEGLVQSINTKT